MSSASHNSRIAITNIRVFNGLGLTSATTVFIQDGIIVDGSSIEGAELIDGKGQVLLPGLIDSHVHVAGEHHLKQLASYGVTTALDMGSFDLELLKLKGKPGMADFRTSGIVAVHPKSFPAKVLPLPKQALISSLDQVSPFITARVKESMDYIKILSDMPGFDQQTINALISEAHSQNRQVIVHATSLLSYQMASESGADFLTHAPMDKVLTSTIISRIIEQKQVVIPTLIMEQGMCKNLSFLGKNYNFAIESVRNMHKAGVTILVGTDANASRMVPNQVVHGESMVQEMINLVSAGMTPLDVLRSATILPAQCFKLTNRGRIAPGYRADLVLVHGNPIEDIRAVRNVQRVWCAGKEVTHVASKHILTPALGLGTLLGLAPTQFVFKVLSKL